MDRTEYDNQKLKSYLLGGLSETETGSFDEASVTDEKFADALLGAENDLIDAYLQNELNDATRSKFESVYLAAPRRREKVEFAKAFQIYAAKKAGSLAFDEAPAAETKSGFFSRLNFYQNQNSLLNWGIAAALLLFAFGAWFVYQRLNRQETIISEKTTPALSPPPAAQNANTEISKNEKEIAAVTPEIQKTPLTEKTPVKNPNEAEPARTPEVQKTPVNQTTIAAFMLAPPLRGGTQLKTLSIPKEVTDVKINLQLESDDYSAYRVALVNESGGTERWRSPTLKSNGKAENKSLNVKFPARLLKSQIYSLVVSGVNSTGEVEVFSNYSFKVVR